MINETVQIKGSILIEKGINGKVTDSLSQSNLVVSGGKNFFAERILGFSNRLIDTIAIGSSSISAQLTDVELLDERAKRDIEFSQRENNILLFLATFPEGVGSGVIREVGLFDNNDIMICRSVLQTQFTKTENEFLNVTWKLQIG